MPGQSRSRGAVQQLNEEGDTQDPGVAKQRARPWSEPMQPFDSQDLQEARSLADLAAGGTEADTTGHKPGPRKARAQPHCELVLLGESQGEKHDVGIGSPQIPLEPSQLAFVGLKAPGWACGPSHTQPLGCAP
jgi:hypothetical protein